jgi:hypothetical protein
MVHPESLRLTLLQELSQERIDALPATGGPEDDRLGAFVVVDDETKVEGGHQGTGANQIVDTSDPFYIPDGWGDTSSVLPTENAPQSEVNSNGTWADSPLAVPDGVLERGHLAPGNQSFCSLYKLSNLLNLQLIEPDFHASLAAGLLNPVNFWTRAWHLYVGLICSALSSLISNVDTTSGR